MRREVQTDSGSKGIVGMFLPSFLEIRAGQSGTHTIAHFPDITLHLANAAVFAWFISDTTGEEPAYSFLAYIW